MPAFHREAHIAPVGLPDPFDHEPLILGRAGGLKVAAKDQLEMIEPEPAEAQSFDRHALYADRWHRSLHDG